MSEENKVAETIRAVQGVVEAVPVYQDALQPAAKELGAALHTVARSVNIALAPVSALVWGFDKVKEFAIAKIAQRLARIDPEKIVAPRPEVAGPALEALRYSGHDENLRELYGNLLATSMDADTAANAHPGFVEIIRNLSPDEARIMRLFAVRHEFPVVDLQGYKEATPSEFKVIVSNFSLVGIEAGCNHPMLVQSYIDNLCRLRMLEIPEGVFLTASNIYPPLETHPALQPWKDKAQADGRKVRFMRKVLIRTNWGIQFARACVIEKETPTTSGTNTNESVYGASPAD